MNIKDLFKSKTDEEIEKIIESLSGEELMDIGKDMMDFDMVKLGLEKTNTKVWGLDYNSSSSDLFDSMINLKTLYELIELEKFQDVFYVKLRNIMTGKEDEWSLHFFTSRYKPIYKNNKHLKIMDDVIGKVKKILI